jgi:hypothetical protein
MTDLSEAKKALLAEWEQKRDQLNVLISALRAELGMSEEETASTVTNASPQVAATGPIRVEEIVQPGDFFGMTQVGAAKEFLSRLNKRTASLNEIGSALYRGKVYSEQPKDVALKNLSSLLSRSDDFISVAKGRWGLSEWYPNMKKKSRKPTEEAAEKQEATSA